MALGLFMSVLIPFFLGYLCVSSIFSSLNLSFLSRLGLGYFIGLWIITQAALLLWIMGLTVNLLTILFVLSIFLIVFIAGRGISGPFTVPSVCSSLCGGFIKQLALFFIAVNAVLIVVVAFFTPIYAWDTIASEAYKAKMLFFDGSLSGFQHSYYPNFPLFTVVSLAWVAFNQGVWDDRYMNVIFAIGFLAFIPFFYGAAKRLTGSVFACLAVVVLFSSNLLVQHAMLSYRDIFLMATNSVCVLGLIFWGEDKNDSHLFMAALFAGISLSIKMEALAYCPIYGVVIVLTAAFFRLSLLKAVRAAAVFFLIVFAMYLPFLGYRFVVGAGETQWAGLSSVAVPLGDRLGMILARFGTELFLQGNWNIFFWPLFLLSSVLTAVLKDKISLLLFLIIMAFFVMYGFVFLFTKSFMAIQYPWTISRYFFPAYALAVLFVVRVFYVAYSQYKEKV